MADRYNYIPAQQPSHRAQYQPNQGGIPPQSTTNQPPIDPALMYTSYYPPYGDVHRLQSHGQQPGSHLGLSNMHSPSDDSESAASPTAESNANGKRPVAGANGSNKKQRKDSDGTSQSPGVDKEPPAKAKPTRGSRRVKSHYLSNRTHLDLFPIIGHAQFADALK